MSALDYYVEGIEEFASQLNVVGPQVRKMRTNKGWTWNQLALKLQRFGWDSSWESATRLESQSRQVPDLELFVVAKIFGRQIRRSVSAQPARPGQGIGPSFYRVKLSRGQVPPTA